MSTHRSQVVFLALTASLAGLLLPPGLPAAEVDTSTWSCSRCPFAEGFSGDVALGARVVTDDSNKFGDYTGYDDDGVFPGGAPMVRYSSEEGYTAAIEGFGYSQDSFNLGVEAGHQGRWMSRIELDRLPSRQGESTRTVYRNLGDSPLRLEDNWVRASSTAGMTSLDDDLRGFDVSWDRETIGAGFDYLFTPNLKLDTDYRYQSKDGKGRTWGSFLGNAAELVRPLDYDTHEAEAGLTYAGSDWQLRASMRGSWFNNSDHALNWDNAFTGVDRGRMAQDPDNSAYYFNLGGAWQILDNTTASATASLGKFEQDDDFLPYTINPNIVTNALPRSDLNGEVDVTHFDLRVTSAPWSRLRLTGEYRYDERDNDSAVETWETVSADSVPGAVERNLAYDYQRWDADFVADLRVTSGLKASAGYTRSEIDRNRQEVDENHTNTYWGKLRLRPSERFSLDLKAEGSSRDGEGYEQVDFLNLSQNPRMRKYYMADRDRHGYEVQASFYPSDRLSFGFRVESWDEDYDDSEVGITDAERDSVVADATLQITDAMSTYASVSHETIDSVQFGAQSNVNPNTADPNWRAKNDDEFNSASVGFRWDRILEKWGLQLDYTYAESDADISQRSFGLKNEFPTIDTTTHSAQLNVTYDLRPNIRLRGGWWYQKYDTDDWALDGVREDTIGSVLTWGGNSPDYEVSVISLSFVYSLAPPPQAYDPPR